VRVGSVVDEDIEPPEPLQYLFNNCVRRVGIGYVPGHGEGPVAKLPGQRVGALLIADIHRDRCSARNETLRGRAPESASRARNQGDTSFEVISGRA